MPIVAKQDSLVIRQGTEPSPVCWPTEPDENVDDSPFLTTDEGKGVSELVGRKRRVGNALGLYGMVKNLDMQ